MNDQWFSVAVSEYKLSSKIPPGDPIWHAFNGSFHNVDLQSRDLLNVIYMGRPITTHHKNKWRSTENFLLGQHIGLDFDSEDDASRMKTLINDKFVKRYASFVHTTVSHTEEKPRARVVFLLDTPIHQAKNYGLAASALLWLFGTADRQCKDAARFFYGAQGCKFEFLDNVLPLDLVKKMITNYLESGASERKKSTRSNYLPPASQKEVSDALSVINPWQIDYDEWVAILMAIHSQFGDGGYQLAESWAEGKQGEVNQKWKSFKQSGNGAGQITIATLFGIAKRFGWQKENYEQSTI